MNMITPVGPHRVRPAVLAAIVSVLALLPAAQAATPATAVPGLDHLPCLDEFSRIATTGFREAQPDYLLQVIGRDVQARSTWARGDPQYDKARGIVADALAADERAHGPLLAFTTSKMTNKVVAAWSADDRAYFTRFFSRPAGRLFVSDILDGAVCKGQLTVLGKPPLAPLSRADQAQVEALQKGLEGAMDRFMAKLNALSPGEKQSFDAGYKKLGQSFEMAQAETVTEDDALLRVRIDRALRPHRDALVQLAKSP